LDDERARPVTVLLLDEGSSDPGAEVAAAWDETRKRRALHGSLCTTYARFQFPTAMVAEHATAPLA
jgi:hypothetical protein